MERLRLTNEKLARLEETLRQEPNNVLVLNELAELAAKDGKHAAALAYYDRVLAIKPDDGGVWYNSAMVAEWMGDETGAYRRAAKACAIAPSNTLFSSARRHLASKVIPTWHFSMMNDASRNFAYADAIARNVKPGQTVLEIGTGAGLLAMLAARNKPKRVVTCETNPIMADKAREIIAANGLSHLVTVVPKISTDLILGEDLPEKANVLITETFGPHIVGEGMIEALADAKARLLAPGAVFIPSSGNVCGALVTSNFLASLARVEKVCGFDVSAMNEFSPLGLDVFWNVGDLSWLSEEADLLSFDFARDDIRSSDTKTIEIEVTAPGRCLGLMYWLRVHTDEEVAYENLPQPDQTPVAAWPPALHSFPDPIDVRKGQRLLLEISYSPRSVNVHILKVTGASTNPYMPGG